jgi:NitT/TauT family transport system permease protein
VALGSAGLAAIVALWWLATALISGEDAMVAQFTPLRTRGSEVG